MNPGPDPFGLVAVAILGTSVLTGLNTWNISGNINVGKWIGQSQAGSWDRVFDETCIEVNDPDNPGALVYECYNYSDSDYVEISSTA